MTKIPHNPDEIIANVDESDNVLGETSRKEAHEKGLLHREVYIYLINSKKQVLLHKRLDNHLWDHSNSGHFPKNQNYEEAALREFEEELGIKLDLNELKEIGFEKLRTEKPQKINYRFAKIFLIRKDIPINEFNIDKDEIEEIKYFDNEEINKLLNSSEKIMTGSSKKIIQKYILPEML